MMLLLRYWCFTCLIWNTGTAQKNTVSLDISFHLNLRRTLFSRPLRRAAAQPQPSPRYVCALVTVMHQRQRLSTTGQEISDLVCSSMFAASDFLPLNSIAWGFLKRGM